MNTPRKGLRIVAFALSLAAVLGLAVPAFALTIAAYGTALADTTVYSGTDKTTPIGTFSKGDTVAIVSSSGSMYQVNTAPNTENTGYVDKTALSGPYQYTALTALSTMKSAAGTTATTTSTSTSTGTIYNVKSDVNMRSKASSKGSVVMKVKLGTTVTILGTSGSYYQVSVSGKTGYIDKRYVDTAPAPVVNSTPDTGAITLGTGKIKVDQYKSTPSATVTANMAAAQAKNSEVIGYINLPGTNIQQPILYHKASVHYYATHDINKKSSSSGAIYAFYGDMVRNNTITGHNMRQSGTMFSELHVLQEKALGYTKSQSTDKGAKIFDLASFPSITTLNTWEVSLFGYTKWQVFAMYETAAKEPTSTLKYNINPLSSYTPAQIKDWVAYQKSRSEIKFNVPVSTDDIFLTVYTCGNNYDSSSAQSRIYFFLKAVA